MSTLDQHLRNSHWRAMYNYAQQPPNNGHYRRWVQGSPGMMEPLPVYSNEFSHLYMKRGTNVPVYTRGGIKPFSVSADARVNAEIQECSRQTRNPAGCVDTATRYVFTKDALRYDEQRRYPRHSPSVTPHPYDISYQDGHPVGMLRVPPNTWYQE